MDDAGESMSKFDKRTADDEAHPVQIITTDESKHAFTLDDVALAKLLLHPSIRDKKVAVISVAGAFRKGKSFLLNFLLRFLQAPNTHSRNWMGDDSEYLNGFSWRGGSERETSGILFWSRPFLVATPSGEEIAVLLMDTQGAFDSQSTVKDCATIFALSTMISSLQIYNLSQNIQEDDLQHLQLFTEYGRLALEDSAAKPFQSLLFLVRDWSFPYEAEYGLDGGARILEKRLQVSDKQHPELQQLRRHIRSCFSDIGCFLMPHPGLRVSTNPSFRGQLLEIETEFKTQLNALIPRLLSPANLITKEINGSKVKCIELLEYFRAYIKIFQGEELPEPKSMLLATAEANNLAAVADAKGNYCRGMERLCGGDTPFMSTAELLSEHQRHYDDAVKHFVDKRKMGGSDFSKQFLDKLDLELQEAFENFVKVNNGKNLFRSAQTPAVFFLLLVIVYFMQQFFALVYLTTLASTCGAVLGVIILTLILWAYARYSGTFRDAGAFIDDVAGFLWDNVFHPMSARAMQEGVKHATTLQRSVSQASSAGNVAGRQRTSVTSARSVHRKQQ